MGSVWRQAKVYGSSIGDPLAFPLFFQGLTPLKGSSIFSIFETNPLITVYIQRRFCQELKIQKL
jgi:hypothetical protein